MEKNKHKRCVDCPANTQWANVVCPAADNVIDCYERLDAYAKSDSDEFMQRRSFLHKVLASFSHNQKMLDASDILNIERPYRDKQAQVRMEVQV
jgi:hypothetical protein